MWYNLSNETSLEDEMDLKWHSLKPLPQALTTMSFVMKGEHNSRRDKGAKLNNKKMEGFLRKMNTNMEMIHDKLQASIYEKETIIEELKIIIQRNKCEHEKEVLSKDLLIHELSSQVQQLLSMNVLLVEKEKSQRLLKEEQAGKLKDYYEKEKVLNESVIQEVSIDDFIVQETNGVYLQGYVKSKCSIEKPLAESTPKKVLHRNFSLENINNFSLRSNSDDSSIVDTYSVRNNSFSSGTVVQSEDRLPSKYIQPTKSEVLKTGASQHESLLSVYSDHIGNVGNEINKLKDVIRDIRSNMSVNVHA